METRKFIVRNSEFVEFKQKNLARRLVAKALRAGQITRSEVCELCDKKDRTNAHHVDYGQPLKIMWLCSHCHGLAHRRLHPLNPKNNPQSPNPILWDKVDTIPICLTIPVKNFIALRKLSEESGIPFSRLIRGNILKDFPVEDDQMEFDFERNVI